MPVPVVGGVPRREDYFGQEHVITGLWKKLEKDNILLAAPRRFGKTAAMYGLFDNPKEDFVPVYTNVEYINTAGDFMVELIAAIYRKKQFKKIVNKLWEGVKDVASFFRDLPEDIDMGGVKIKIREKTDVSTDWLSYGERLMELFADESPRLLLILDEFAVMIDHIVKRDKAEAETLLRWFRSARLAPNTRTRFVIGGSIHLIPMLDALGLVDTVNDLFVQKIKPFTVETARSYIAAVFESEGIPLTDEVSDMIIKLVGTPIPYFLAVLVTALFDYPRGTGAEITPEVVKAVFEEDLLEGSTAISFAHYHSRLNVHYPEWEGPAAKSLLRLLSRADDDVTSQSLYHLFLDTLKLPHSTENEEKFMYLMNKLDNDFYISCTNRKCGFFSRVLKLWWRNRFGFQKE